jgi:hypothetical protein
MPRRIGKAADTTAARGALARINLVIRNSRFQKELTEVQGRHAINKLAERWGLFRIPVLTRDAHIGRLISSTDSGALLAEIPSYIPRVELLRAYLFEALNGPEVVNDFQYREILEMKIDLSYPMDILEEAIRAEVRKAKIERARLQAASGVLAKRTRLDKTDFQLKVYDLAKEAKTFTEIRDIIRKPLSTIKSAFLVAKLNINNVKPIEEELPPSTDETKLPTKKGLPIVGFDPEEHSLRCSVCRQANDYDKMCGQAKAFAEQDYASERGFHRNVENLVSRDFSAPIEDLPDTD